MITLAVVLKTNDREDRDESRENDLKASTVIMLRFAPLDLVKGSQILNSFGRIC